MSTQQSSPREALAALREGLGEVTLRDAGRLGRRLDGVRGIKDPARQAQALAQVAADVATAQQRLVTRAAAMPRITYPEQLPVSGRREDIAAAIRDHQVVVVAGETGSGKTTQLPKICLELGRGVRGQIGHTQPRRIAARSVAERIAEELAVPLGEAVGYKVRFTDRASDSTLVKVMTDGILLAEMQGDRMLTGYDTIIIDEAHERSLNIDFILGYLKQLLPRRPDLKVVITSATIDPLRFSAHFGGAPVVEVSGRTFPVEVRYRPLVQPAVVDEDDDLDDLDRPEGRRNPLLAKGKGGRPEDGTDVVRDQVEAICDAVSELAAEGPGDVLVFLSGEREIRDAAEALNRLQLRHTEVLPLYARLSAAEQHRVFTSHTGRRVVLATNVAETSLTVPGIKYVVDPGTARISRYSNRLKVQRLPIEPVSQASANQRAGRCGRTSDGICIRLYDEEDYLARPEFTEPEILRTNLASVILQMTALGLGDVDKFQFVDPPDRRSVKDGVDLLVELGALDPAKPAADRLTPVGRRLAQLPVDPRLGRMILEAHANGCVREVMVITAALSIQDVRERPVDAQQQADEKHRRFADETSDFVTLLRLWEYLREQQKELSSSAFRRLCRSEYLNYLRVREWQDLYAQLRQLAKSLDVTLNSEPADPQRVHQSLLAGLLSHIGLRDAAARDYQGARGARFSVFPGSAVAKKQPSWLMAAELVETSKLWGRTVAKIEPEWVEPLAGHLVKRTYSEPHWEKKRASVVAVERVTLYGVPIVAGRTVQYGRVDPELSRELFVRHALVEGDWETRHAFFAENRRLLDDVEDLENRARRRDILVDDETLFAFYDQLIPADVVSGRHFDAWWKQARRETPDLLTYTPELLVSDDADEVSEADYPDVWRQGELTLGLTYQFEPGAAADGVTAHVPVTLLNRVSPDGFEWQIPGLRHELVTALIRSLPKALRRSFVPAPDTAKALLGSLHPRHEPLLEAVARELSRVGGFPVPRDELDLEKVPEHLRMTFRVEDAQGRMLAEGKDLDALKVRLKPKVATTISQVAQRVERAGLTDWSIGELPRTFAADGVRGFPALVDQGTSVAVKVLPTEADQQRAMVTGTRRLLLLTTQSPAKTVLGRLDNRAKLALSHAPHGGAVALFDDCLACTVDVVVEDAGGPAWDAAGFAALRDAVRGRAEPVLTEVVTVVADILAVAGDVERAARSTSSLVLLPALTDVREQLAALVHTGFVAETGYHRLRDVARYLRAAVQRLEKLPERPERDRELMWRVELVEQSYADLRARLKPGAAVPPALDEIRWMVEELRVSFWAQHLGTPYPVSEKRIQKAMDAVAATLP
ncbi:ATP-dependent RNA helicase HrpA [Kineosporia sp. A_224]|uniref:ATP-dependent RNA helicase HrpA n=1 Tax=Kineosporia sp. A_224 TaxID=1962180 RepID=UPI000B4C159E|nr:ATP-dependent RNA helicase HrpA [Kineosporia sp. A_224]